MAEAFYFEPRTGTFDVAQAEHFLSGLGHPVQDPVQPARFLLFAADDEAREFRANRTADPHTPLPYVCIVNLYPERISVALLCDARDLEFARQFIGWLLARYDCHITDDDGQDRT